MLTIAGGIILAIILILISLVVLAFLPEILRGAGALILGGIMLVLIISAVFG